jgi:hypothetical protein
MSPSVARGSKAVNSSTTAKLPRIFHLRTGSAARPLRTYVEVAYDWLGRFGLLGANSDLVCVVDRPGGGCEPPYPDVTGPSVSIGLLYAPITRVETRLGVGGAAYSIDGTRVGAAVGQLDAAVFPTVHLGLILGARFAVIPRYRQDRLTMIPVFVGLRVQ